jgi:hypothetical protein
MEDDILFPQIEVQLTGRDGNAFMIIGTVAAALRRAGHYEAAETYVNEATSGDYNNVLTTSMRTVTVL